MGNLRLRRQGVVRPRSRGKNDEGGGAGKTGPFLTMAKNYTYIIIDMNSGLMDGIYMYREDAVQMLEYHRSREPNGQWVMAEVSHDTNGTYGIPDKVFWARNQ